VLSTRVLREWQANDAACLRCMVYAAGWTFYGVQIAVLHRRREVWRQASWAAIQGHTRGELLFVYFAFTGSGERAIHPTTHLTTQLPQAHLRAEIHSALTLSCKRSWTSIVCRCHRSRPTRDFITVKPQTAHRLRIGDDYDRLRKSRGSRGR